MEVRFAVRTLFVICKKWISLFLLAVLVSSSAYARIKVIDLRKETKKVYLESTALEKVLDLIKPGLAKKKAEERADQACRAHGADKAVAHEGHSVEKLELSKRTLKVVELKIAGKILRLAPSRLDQVACSEGDQKLKGTKGLKEQALRDLIQKIIQKILMTQRLNAAIGDPQCQDEGRPVLVTQVVEKTKAENSDDSLFTELEDEAADEDEFDEDYIRRISRRVPRGSESVSKVEAKQPVEKVESKPKKALKVKVIDQRGTLNLDPVKKAFGSLESDRGGMAKLREEGQNEFRQLIQSPNPQSQPDISKVTKSMSQKVRGYVGQIFSEEVNRMRSGDPKKEAPGKFNVFTMGSLARSESGIYTDLEIGYLVEKDTPEMQKYLAELTQRIADRVHLLGEGEEGMHLDVADYAPPYLQFDSRYMDREKIQDKILEKIRNKKYAEIPLRGSRALIATPDKLAEYFDPNKMEERHRAAVEAFRENSGKERSGRAQHSEFVDWIQGDYDGYSEVWALDESEYNLVRKFAGNADKLRDISKILAEKAAALTSGASVPSLDAREKFDRERQAQKLLEVAEKLEEQAKKNGDARFWVNRSMGAHTNRERQQIQYMPRLLRNIDYLWSESSEDLFKQYSTARKAVLDKQLPSGVGKIRQDLARQVLREDLRKYREQVTGKLGGKTDLKRTIYRPVEQIMTSMGFFYGFDEQNTIKIAEKLGEIGVLKSPAPSAEEVKDLMNFIMELRLKAQLKLKKQGWDIYFDEAEYQKDLRKAEQEVEKVKNLLSALSRMSVDADLESLDSQIADKTEERATLVKTKADAAAVTASLKDLEAQRAKLAKLQEKDRSEVAELQEKLSSTEQEVRELKEVAPGKILVQSDVEKLKNKYVPLLKKLYDFAVDWSKNPF